MAFSMAYRATTNHGRFFRHDPRLSMPKTLLLNRGSRLDQAVAELFDCTAVQHADSHARA
jgi:hypothetical protein